MHTILCTCLVLLLSTSALLSQDSASVAVTSPLHPEVHLLLGSNNDIDGSHAPPYALGVRGCIDTPFWLYCGASFVYIFGGSHQSVSSGLIFTETTDLTLMFLELGVSIHARPDFSIRGYGIFGSSNTNIEVASSGTSLHSYDNEVCVGGGISIQALLGSNWVAAVDTKLYAGSSAGFLTTLGIGYRF